MISKAKIINMINSIMTKTSVIGGFTNDQLLSVKGLYSKPKNEDAIALEINNNFSNKFIIPLQKKIDKLLDNDIILTDDKSEIYFNNKLGAIDIFSNGGDIKLQNGSSYIQITNDTIIINANNIIINGNLTNNGVNIGNTHTHNITSGSSAGTTTPPN